MDREKEAELTAALCKLCLLTCRSKTVYLDVSCACDGRQKGAEESAAQLFIIFNDMMP